MEIGVRLLLGIVTFRRSHELREIARKVPRDRILVETDAPFLAPEPHRGRTNEPALPPTPRALSLPPWR